jgi:uncharacterized protein YndB with AHSA1/START domain
MHRNEHAIEIAAVPDALFPWLVEPELRLRWMGALVESEAVTPGPAEQGSLHRDVFEDHGQRTEVDAELVEVDPGRALTVKLDAKGFEATSSQRLEAIPGGTRLSVVARFTMLAARLLAPIVTRHAQKQLETDLARLKELVETEAAAG